MDAPVQALCYHCGEPLALDPVHLPVDGQVQPFCCAGCAAAANWIGEAELGDYYRLRSANGSRVQAEALDFSAWNRPDLLAEHSREVEGGREMIVLTDAMRCAACAWLIDRALRREPGVLDAGANAITGRVRVRWDPALTSPDRLMQRLAGLGYRPWLATGEARERARRDERRRWLIRVGVAGLGAMQAMMFAEALFLDTAGEMPLATRDFLRWITFLVSTPVVFYAGWPFLEGMAREMRGRRLGMDSLIALSTLLAYFASLVETVRGGPHVWYDAAVMFVLLLLLARMLEQRARRVASAQVDTLAHARPALAMRETPGAGVEQVTLAELSTSDVVLVSADEPVPADGILLDAACSFDESLLSGESTPIRHEPGEAILAGSYCRERSARIRLTHTGQDTRLSQLTRLVEQAQATRPPLARLADRIASRFVIVILACAAAVFAWWQQHDPSRALEVTLALLVVSCPCALSLAIPTALTAAHGALAKMGVLGIDADALGNLARVTHVVFDKTGTLSWGSPELAGLEPAEGEDVTRVRQIAAALERGSAHPWARTLAALDASLVASDVHSVPGLGLEGRVDGQTWRIGRGDFATGMPDDGAVWLGDGERALARFQLRERVRPDAGAAIAMLKGNGVGMELCSGDAEPAVLAMARAVGIDQARARQSPEQKLARVRELQAQGAVVAMVGDGINDAPVLAAANVSLAMADGAALAQGAADLVITSPSLLRLPQAIELARRTRRIIRQNLAWAVGYNLLALPLAAAGLVSPWLAAIGMALSSLIVTLNALRLSRGSLR